MTATERPLRPVDEPTGEDYTRPHDSAAEAALLGAAMHSPAVLDDAGILYDDLYEPAHAILYDAITRLDVAGQPTDPVSVAAWLIEHRLIGKAAPGGTRLDLYAVDVHRDANVAFAPYHARIVKDAARARRLIDTGQRLQQLGNLARQDDLDRATHLAVEELERLTRDGTRAGDREPVDWKEFWARPPEPPDLLAAGVLARKRITLLYGPGKVGKSLLAQDIAVRLALGAPTLGDPARETMRVLYVDQEMTWDDWRDRLADFNVTEDDDLEPLAWHHLDDWAPFDTPEGGRQLSLAAERHRADIVVLDTLSKVTAGPENDNDTFQAFYRHALVPLKRAGRAALVLDHTGKDLERGARGGRSKTDNVDLVFELLRRGKDLFSLKRTHVRFSHPTELVYLKRRTEPFLCHDIEEADANAEHMVELCLEQLRGFQVKQGASGAETLKVFRGYGSKFTTKTFYEAWRRYRYEMGWTSE